MEVESFLIKSFQNFNQKGRMCMSLVTIEELLEAGIHFGHQTRRWNPKMKPYIWGAKNGIHIINVYKTITMLQKAYDFISDVTSQGKKVLFVGTKKQASEIIDEEANRSEMFYVQNRWLGGMLTNFNTIKKNVKRFLYLNEIENDGTINRFTKKERIGLLKEKEKLSDNIGGISSMSAMPGAIFIVDIKREIIAIKEAKKLGIPIVALVDTNCQPDDVDYIIPGNDDSIKTIRLIASKISDACIEGNKKYEATMQAKAAAKKVVTKTKEEENKPKVAPEKDASGPIVKKRKGAKKVQLEEKS